MKSDVNAPMMDARAPASSTVVTPGSEWLKARGRRKRPVSVNRLSIERFLHQQTTLRLYEEKSDLLWMAFQTEASQERIQSDPAGQTIPLLHLATGRIQISILVYFHSPSPATVKGSTRMLSNLGRELLQ
jgi:hypothetical protein